MSETALVAPGTFDFTGYAPGDIFCVSRADLAKHGMAKTFVVLSALAQAASRAGLLIEPTFNETEMRVLFK